MPPKEQKMRRKSGLTMVEMMVVMGICGVLALLLTPALLHARESARTVACADKLKSLGQAYAMCLTETNGVLPATYYGYSGSSGTYQVSLQTVQSGQPDPFFISNISDCLLCPDDGTPVSVLARNGVGNAAEVPSSYAYNIALPLIFRNASRVTAPVNTVTFFDGDVSSVVGTWSYSGDWAASAMRPRHSGQANLLYLDGHVIRPDGFPTAAFNAGQCWVASSLNTNISGASSSSGSSDSGSGTVQQPPQPVQPPPVQPPPVQPPPVQPPPPPAPTAATILCYVWHDEFHSQTHPVNGIRDADEPGIPGIQAQLLNSSKSQVASGTTDATGECQFQSLPSGTYTVQFAASNFATGGPLAGWYPAPQTGVVNHATSVTVTGNQVAEVDFGFFIPSLLVTVTGPPTAKAGSTITYNFTFQNTGDLVLHGGGHVYDPLLCPSGDNEIWETVVWPGQVYEFSQTYKIPKKTTGQLVNSIEGLGHPCQPNGIYLSQDATMNASWTTTVTK
jgi:prepilin-type processing-associated H-X9-DG protein/prepilin-type N-terminal cleavage/methylation domain-containing protein